MNKRKRHLKFIVGAAIVFIFLISIDAIISDPTRPGHSENPTVLINEVYFGDPSANDPLLAIDWIEIVNVSNSTVDLTDWTLTDDPERPDFWRFPPTEIRAGEHLLLLPSNRDIEVLSIGAIPVDVRLNNRGGFLALYPPTTRRFLDSQPVVYGPQIFGRSFGRYVDNSLDGSTEGYGYLNAPTAAAPNSSGVFAQGITAPVTVDIERGFYESPQSITLGLDPQFEGETTKSDAEIRYTLDGSTPTAEHGKLYVEPIEISETTILRAVATKAGYLSGPVQTHTYIFAQDVVDQTDVQSGWPESWGTHKIDFGGYQADTLRQADYEMDPEITADSVYGPLLKEGLRNIPTLSLVTDMVNFEAIYSDPQKRGVEAEVPASVEILPSPNIPSSAEPPLLDIGIQANESYSGSRDSLSSGIQTDAGLRIQGGAGRVEFMPKHSFRLFFKREYGDGKLRAQIFPDSPLAEFDTLVLRAGVDRAFPGHPPAPDKPDVDHRLTTYARDQWTRNTQIEMSGIGSHGIFAHLYINGLYWGLYNVVERPDQNFASAYMGGERADWFAANHGGAVEGLPDRFNVLIQLAQEGGLEDPERYATILEFIDPVTFSDYLLLNWYVGNRDWPQNNWYSSVQYPAGRNHFFVWDAEDTWNSGAEINLESKTFPDAPYPNVIKLVFEALWQNEEFRLLFADRAHYQLTQGALDDEASQMRWLALTDEIEQAIVAESARWGDVRYDDPVTMDDWQRAREDVLTQMDGNGEKLLELLKGRGWYPNVDAPILSASPPPEELGWSQVADRGEAEQFNTTISFSANSGTIYYTLNDTDPRDPALDGPAAGAQIYGGPVEVSMPVTVKARALEEGEWSALTVQTIHIPEEHSNVRISEIMYHPIGGEEYEFIELRNVGALEADLSLAYFEGIDFRFPVHTTLGAGERIVLINDFRSFRERYADAEIHGVYGGNLSNRGEALTFFGRDGTVLDRVTFDDENGWPLSADGKGDSLVRIDFERDGDDSQAWTTSEVIYGTPGE